jgi:hypothetical protein
MAPLASLPKTGFEAVIHTRNADSYIAVRALSSSGSVLGTSVVVTR